ncbi:Pre-mRNA-splicing factor 18 [Armadillidium nasatum]|uniref:Pre-mRNA-splicing factor 18 n=1 Tax=Armadillidium nasatum TaxID=96803 RepID=A0A5N5TKC0_9CRUS|nr:Pre-mRNA-splicing factor 18 [Armadillidium nasatum]
MLQALKDEISKKKRSLEESKIFTNEKKYFKRAELDRIMYGQSSSEIADSVKKNDDKKFNETNNISKCEDVDEGPTLPRTEVIRRLREREEPIFLFGEEEVDAFRRLRKLEILEPEINRGLRNDFQEALERVDRAYLNEILKTADEKDVSKNVALQSEEEFTIEGVQELAKALSTEDSNELRCKMILHFVQLILQLWGNNLNTRKEAEKMSVKGKMDCATYTQTHCYLKPLTKRLKTRSLPEDILESLTEIVLHCLERDYVKANDAYLQMAIGNAPWPIGVTMVGIHARTGREKIFSKHVAHVLNDETQRKYIQGLKRLITKCQSYFAAPPSRCVEYQVLPES